MGIFHRPRAEAELIIEQGFDPKSASFQFVNISNADMGPWMQQLVTQEGWLRSTVEIAPVPFTLDIPNQRPFEKHSILCFRHPSLPPLEGTSCLIQSMHWLARHSYHYLEASCRISETAGRNFGSRSCSTRTRNCGSSCC